MINSTRKDRPDLQAADASEGGYEINMGDKKAFDKGYEKFCKKYGLQVGWKKQTLQYKNREKKS
jgi:hypothetical protein